jgi:type II secretory pathway pseudopilin PulG
MRILACLNQMIGFTLIETMLSLVILTFGLLATGQMLYVTGASKSLERSKGTAAIAAQSVLESLGALYQQNPLAAELSLGNHGPKRIEVTNPINGKVLNTYSATWSVEQLPDPRPGKSPNARLVRTTIAPVRTGGEENSRQGFNKVLCISTIFSPISR